MASVPKALRSRSEEHWLQYSTALFTFCRGPAKRQGLMVQNQEDSGKPCTNPRGPESEPRAEYKERDAIKAPRRGVS